MHEVNKKIATLAEKVSQLEAESPTAGAWPPTVQNFYRNAVHRARPREYVWHTQLTFSLTGR